MITQFRIIRSLIAAIFISGIAGYLGTLMLSKRMSAAAGPLAHLALPGAALSIIYGLSLFVGVFPSVLLGAVFIWFLEKRTRLPMENLSAIIFAAGVGTTLLILPIDKAEEALIGNIMKITNSETLATVTLTILVFYLIKKIYPKMSLINIDEDLATVEGVNINFYNLIYLLVIAVVVGLGVYLVGGLITVALIAIPAASARNISVNLRWYKILAVFFAVSSAIGGIFIARLSHLPPGPMIVVLSIVLFLFLTFLGKQRV